MKTGISPLLFLVALFVFPLGKAAGDWANRTIHEHRNAPLRALEAEHERIRQAQRELAELERVMSLQDIDALVRRLQESE